VLLSAKALLDDNLDPSTQESATRYRAISAAAPATHKMIEAVQEAARLLREESRTQLTHARPEVATP